MQIKHNITSLYTYRHLEKTQQQRLQATEQISSGLRINDAADDAAGLAISEKMRGQIRGLTRVQKNIQDGISLLQVAEGALNEVHSSLQRVRELTVKALNDTNTKKDRTAIQAEINQLLKEVDRIGNETEFNQQKLLDGSIGVTTNIIKKVTAYKKIVEVSETNAGSPSDSSTVEDDQPVYSTTVTKIVDTNGNFEGEEIKELTKLKPGTHTITVESTGYVAPSQFDGSQSMTYHGSTASPSTITLDGTFNGSQDKTLKAIYHSATAQSTQTSGLSGNISFTDETAYIGEDATWDVKYGLIDTVGKYQLNKNDGNGWQELQLDAAKRVTVDGLELDFSNVDAVSLSDTWEINVVGDDFTVTDGQTTLNDVTSTATIAGVTVDVSQIKGAADLDEWTQSLTAEVQPTYKASLTTEDDGTGPGKEVKPNGGDVTLISGDSSVTVNLGNFEFINTSKAIEFVTEGDQTDNNGGEVQSDEEGDSTSSSSTTSKKSTITQYKIQYETKEVDNSLHVTTGANAGQSVSIDINDMRLKALGLLQVDVTNNELSSVLLTTIDEAITKVSEERSKLGAFQNRLTYTLHQAEVTSLNLIAAESQIRDVDLAEGMMQKTKGDIFSQTSQAMLAQANKEPQRVLELL